MPAPQAGDTPPLDPEPELAQPAPAEGVGDPAGAASAGREVNRSTMEFLYELDEGSISREIDLDANPELANAIAQTSEPQAAAPARESFSQPFEQRSSEMALPPLRSEEARTSVPTIGRPKSAEEQHEHRRRRTVVRVQTTRDAFRLMGYLGIADEDRKGVARQLMDLEQAVGGGGPDQPSLVKEPDEALAAASREQLDTLERLLGPIEDKLLALDDAVSTDTFSERVEAGKHSRKVLARYGRLLASRRFPPGQRRDRFEWIATHLLTAPGEAGERLPLPPDKARPVLQQLVGGLPRNKGKEDELTDALNYLEESRERLRLIKSHEEFFEGGFFLDVRGYNVSMRDQLSNPDYLYLCASVNAEMWNRLEHWITDLEHSHDANRLTAEGKPREQILRRVREQEAAVDKIFGVKRRAVAQAARVETKAAPVEKKAKAARKRSKPRLRIEIDRRLLQLAGALVAVALVGMVLAFETGQIGKEQIQFLDRAQLNQLSPLLDRGLILGEDPHRVLNADMRLFVWGKIEPRKKREIADAIARKLKAQGVKTGTITLRGRTLISIEHGLATTVEGGKM